MSSERLILLTHGSADPRWKLPFERLTRGLQGRLGESAIRLAFLQLAAPSLMDVVAEAARDGVSRVKVLPLFLSVGAHVERDIPAQAHEAQTAHATVEVQLLPAVGTDPRVEQLLTTLALEATPLSGVPA